METISFVPIFNIGILDLKKFLICFLFIFNEKIIADAKSSACINSLSGLPVPSKLSFFFFFKFFKL